MITEIMMTGEVLRTFTVAESERIDRALARNIPIALKFARDVLKNEVDASFGGKAPGRLARSFDVRMADRAIGEIVTYSPAARLFDEGGKMKPKHEGGALAIPLGASKYPKKFTRYSRGSPSGLFLLRIGSKAFLARKTGRGKRKKLQVMFTLKRSTPVHARHFLQAALDRAEPKIIAMLDAAVEAAP